MLSPMGESMYQDNLKQNLKAKGTASPFGFFDSAAAPSFSHQIDLSTISKPKQFAFRISNLFPFVPVEC